MRVMLDTNVLISAIIFPNARMDNLIYKAVLDHQLVLSSYIIEELLEVTRRKFPDRIKDVDLFLILYSAIIEGVDLFVTGDDDFDNVEIEKPEISTPSEFLEKY